MSERLLSAMKFTDESQRFLTPCTVDDPKAECWELTYPGMRYSTSTITFKDKYLAEQVEAAVHAVFDAGKAKAMQNLREFIGVT